MRPHALQTTAEDLGPLSDRALLHLRFCDLAPLREPVPKTPVGGYVRRLHAELAAAGLPRLQPQAYFGDQWFSPEGVPAIAIPWFLAHPRLVRLERAVMRQAEGTGPGAFMKLLRHEAGHCFDHAYDVSGTREWRQIFGVAKRYRPDVYLPDPDSRDFVRHLPGYYAQSHPDEDFAETFAEVITPGRDWRQKYRSWPKALAKCEFVADLTRRHGKRRPLAESGPLCYAAERMRMTLGRYYERRKAEERTYRAAVKKMARQR